MRKRIVGQNGHHDSHSYPVVTAQGGAVGEDVSSVVGNVKTVGGHIQRAVPVFFADHIQMSLQDHGSVIFIPGGTGSEKQQVVQGIVLVGAIAFDVYKTRRQAASK